MNLAEFLLARIAEDEAPAFELIPYSCEPGCCAPAGFVGHRCLICRTEEFGGTVEAITAIAEEHDEDIHRRRRVLAECLAKRRIVEAAEVYADAEFPDYDGGYSSAMDDVLALLALPHADHPDYREEWKP